MTDIPQIPNNVYSQGCSLCTTTCWSKHRDLLLVIYQTGGCGRLGREPIPLSDRMNLACYCLATFLLGELHNNYASLCSGLDRVAISPSCCPMSRHSSEWRKKKVSCKLASSYVIRQVCPSFSVCIAYIRIYIQGNWPKGSIYIEKGIGPRIDPCGTPYNIGADNVTP